MRKTQEILGQILMVNSNLIKHTGEVKEVKKTLVTDRTVLDKLLRLLPEKFLASSFSDHKIALGFYEARGGITRGNQFYEAKIVVQFQENSSISYRVAITFDASKGQPVESARINPQDISPMIIRLSEKDGVVETEIGLPVNATGLLAETFQKQQLQRLDEVLSSL